MLVSHTPTISTASIFTHLAFYSISFGVIKTGAGETTPVQCSAMLTSNGAIPEVTDGTCENSSRTWTFTKFSTNHASGFELAVSQQVTPSSSETGRYDLFDSAFEYQQTGASSQQVYVGEETEFDLVN